MSPVSELVLPQRQVRASERLRESARSPVPGADLALGGIARTVTIPVIWAQTQPYHPDVARQGQRYRTLAKRHQQARNVRERTYNPAGFLMD